MQFNRVVENERFELAFRENTTLNGFVSFDQNPRDVRDIPVRNVRPEYRLKLVTKGQSVTIKGKGSGRIVTLAAKIESTAELRGQLFR